MNEDEMNDGQMNQKQMTESQIEHSLGRRVGVAKGVHDAYANINTSGLSVFVSLHLYISLYVYPYQKKAKNTSPPNK